MQMFFLYLNIRRNNHVRVVIIGLPYLLSKQKRRLTHFICGGIKIGTLNKAKP